jgi:hypothetical protein
MLLRNIRVDASLSCAVQPMLDDRRRCPAAISVSLEGLGGRLRAATHLLISLELCQCARHAAAPHDTANASAAAGNVRMRRLRDHAGLCDMAEEVQGTNHI